MKVTHSADVPTITLPNSALSGVQLVAEGDCGYTSYEARIPANAVVPLRSPDDSKSVHIYYCISGNGKYTTPDGTENDFTPHTAIALSSDMTYQLAVSAEGAMRVFLAYRQDADGECKSLAVVRHLSELVGTERDVDWTSGRSHRYLIKEDGFPIGLHNTSVYAKTKSKLEYRNHIESVYYIAGKATYHWADTNGKWVKEETKIDKDNGTTFFMNLNDPHLVEIDDKESCCLCIFDPVLGGKETHDLSQEKFSIYEA